MNSYKLINGDCLQVMKTLADNSVDLCLTDPPYGTTACKWDSVIPFEPMWKELKRICKPKAAICLFGSQPFTSALIMSNLEMFRYELIWEKSSPTGFLNAKRCPLRSHENLLMFSAEQVTYNPQKWRIGEIFIDRRKNHNSGRNNNRIYGKHNKENRVVDDGTRYPLSIIPIPSIWGKEMHPTQKPVELLRYLIRTYTQENETVLDFTMGSGSTGAACQLENRKFIGIEKDAGYFAIAEKRIKSAINAQPLFDTVNN